LYELTNLELAFSSAKQQYWYFNAPQESQVNVGGVNCPLLHCKTVTEGVYPSVHCGEQILPALMLLPSMQVPKYDD
jgi:hypothetical protein